MGLLDEQPIDLACASGRLLALSRRQRELLAIAAVLAVATAALAAIGGYRWGGACALGAFVSLLLVGQCAGDRRRLLTKLVCQGDANALPEVREFVRWLSSAKQRARLQRALRSAAAIGRGGRSAELSVVRPERAEPVAERLTALAERIGDQSTDVSPLALALCRRLLFESVRSPLLNPTLREQETERVLAIVQARLELR